MNSNITQENMHAESNEFLSFFLGEEHYALDIMTVKEIRGYAVSYTHLTLPTTPYV